MRSAILLTAAVVAVLGLHFGRAAVGGYFVADHSPAEDIYHLSVIYERWAAHLTAGHVPLWMPEFGAGYPAPASWMYGLLYPGLVLFLMLPVEVAWTWTGILHVAFGALGIYLLVRELGARCEGAATAALLFGLSEFMVGRIACGHLNLVLPVAWAPWVLWQTQRAVRGKRGAVLALGVCGALGLLSGHAQVWFYVAPLAGLLAIFALCGEPPAGAWRRLLGALGLVVALSAVQWLPALELVHVADAEPVSRSVLDSTSAPPLHVLARLVPGCLGWRVDGNPLRWGDGPYWPTDLLEHEFLWIGGPWVVLLSLVALTRPDRTRIFWAATAVVGVLLGLGTYLPGGEFLNSIPPLSLARTPGRGLIVALLALPVLCGLGVHTWLEGLAGSVRLRLRRLALPLVLTTAGVVVTLVVVRAALHELPEPVETWTADLGHAEVEAQVLLPAAVLSLAGLFAVALGLVSAGTSGPRRWLPAVLTGAAAWLAAAPPVDTVATDFHRVDWTTEVPAAARDHRLHLFRNRFPPVELYGMRTVRELCHVDTRGFKLLWTPPSGGAAYWLDVRSQALRDWEGAVFEPPPDVLRADLITIEEFPTIGAGALFAIGGEPVAFRPQTIAGTLQEGTYDLYLASEAGDRMTRHAPIGAGTVRRLPTDNPLTETFEVSAPRPAWAVFSEKDYPGWEATVDGAPVRVRSANLALRAVELTRGRHRVAFVYRPLTYRIGLWSAAVAGLVAGVLALRAARRRA